MYLAWAPFYEGGTDAAYFDVLLPRLIEELLALRATRNVEVPVSPAVYIGRRSRAIEAVASEICQERSAFHILFIHADTDGRHREIRLADRREAFADAAYSLCAWPRERTVFISPRHENEGWALADSDAVCRALGYHGDPVEIGLPGSARAAERIVDPKAKLDEVARVVSRRASHGGAARLLPLIAQEQSFTVLRRCTSFQAFEDSLVECLQSLGCLSQ